MKEFLKRFEEKGGSKGGLKWMVGYKKAVSNEDAHPLACIHTRNAHRHVYMHRHNCIYLPQDTTEFKVNENYITRTPSSLCIISDYK